jgi:LmbE family N-acetylglucosaminyl deacetylase
MMAKKIDQRATIYVAIVTNGFLRAPELCSKEGSENIRTETRSAHVFLSIQETFFLDFPSPRLDTIPSYQLYIGIKKIIRSNSISTLYIPHRGNIHKNHRITYEAALGAAQLIKENPFQQILAYETLSETEWAAPFPNEAFIPTYYERITEDQLEIKLKAFQFLALKENNHHNHVLSKIWSAWLV